MSFEISQSQDELELRWPLGPRLVRYVPYLVSAVVWVPLAFIIAALVDLAPTAAMVTAMLPPVALLAIVVPKLAGEFSPRAIRLARRDERIAVGNAGPFAPNQFAISASDGRGWRHAYFNVKLLVRTTIGSAAVELELLNERFRTRDDAARLVETLRAFLEAR